MWLARLNVGLRVGLMVGDTVGDAVSESECWAAGWVDGRVSWELWASEPRTSSELRAGFNESLCSMWLENVAPAVGGGRLQV